MWEDAIFGVVPALQDNYIATVADGRDAVVVDPAEAAPVMRWLYDLGRRLTHILLTHHHADHIGGARELQAATGCTLVHPPDPRIVPGGREVREGDIVIACGIDFHVLEVPGHTCSHIAYHAPRVRRAWVGDVIFSGGCGRMFEGTPEMYLASIRKIAALPDETLLYCGHEYTLGCMEFVAGLEPDNAAVAAHLAAARAADAVKKPTVPTLLGLERRVNPFLRCHDAGLRKALNMAGASDVEVFVELQRRQDL